MFETDATEIKASIDTKLRELNCDTLVKDLLLNIRQSERFVERGLKDSKEIPLNKTPISGVSRGKTLATLFIYDMKQLNKKLSSDDPCSIIKDFLTKN